MLQLARVDPVDRMTGVEPPVRVVRKCNRFKHGKELKGRLGDRSTSAGGRYRAACFARVAYSWACCLRFRNSSRSIAVSRSCASVGEPARRYATAASNRSRERSTIGSRSCSTAVTAPGCADDANDDDRSPTHLTARATSNSYQSTRPPGDRQGDVVGLDGQQRADGAPRPRVVIPG